MKREDFRSAEERSRYYQDMADKTHRLACDAIDGVTRADLQRMSEAWMRLALEVELTLSDERSALPAPSSTLPSS